MLPPRPIPVDQPKEEDGYDGEEYDDEGYEGEEGEDCCEEE